MSNLESLWNRLGIITKLAEKQPRLGRTALMKYLYFLKEIYNVPIDYDFRLYTYGPFDSDVLDDLSYAESLQAVESESVIYHLGYGYEISRGLKAEEITHQAADFLVRYEKELDKVVDNFKNYKASELELLATIVYVDRELSQNDQEVTRQSLITRTREIKPRYSEEEIEKKINALIVLDFIVSHPRSSRLG